MPLDVDRVAELPWTGRRVAEVAPARVLDIASPKLLACWLAERTAASVVATDLWSAEIERWRGSFERADPSGRRFQRLTLETADGTALPYADASFDVAYSVSVIEHIPGPATAGDVGARARAAPWRPSVLTFPSESDWRRSGSSTTSTRALRGRALVLPATTRAKPSRRDCSQTAPSTSSSRPFGARKECHRPRRQLHRIVPRGWHVGRLLGPASGAHRHARDAYRQLEDPGPDNVLGLVSSVARRTAWSTASPTEVHP